MERTHVTTLIRELLQRVRGSPSTDARQQTHHQHPIEPPPVDAGAPHSTVEPNWLSANDRPDRLSDRDGPILLGSITKTSGYYLNLSASIWSYLVLSLPLDVVLFALHLPEFPPFAMLTTSFPHLHYFAWGLFVLACVFTWGDPLQQSLEWGERTLREFQTQAFLKTWWLPILAIGYFAIELLLQFGQFGIQALIAIVVVLIGAGRSILQARAAQQSHLRALMADKLRWVALRNYQNFMMAVIPLGAVRLASLVLVLHGIANQGSAIEHLPYLLLASVLLIALYPRREQFVTRCDGCARWTSRALKGFGFCPTCAPSVFVTSVDSGAGQ